MTKYAMADCAAKYAMAKAMADCDQIWCVGIDQVAMDITTSSDVYFKSVRRVGIS